MGDLLQWSYVRAADKIAYVVFGGILLSWLVYFSFLHIPAFYHLTGDPDCVYAASAILLSGGEKVTHTDHPGTIVQVIGACIALVLGIDKALIFEPESYERIFMGWRIFVLITFLFVLLKMWKAHTQSSPMLISLPLVFLFGTRPVFENLIFMLPESFYLSGYLLFLLSILTLITNERVASWGRWVPLGIVAGVLSTAKYLLFPVILYLALLICLYQRGSPKHRICHGAIFLVMASAAFFIFSGAVSSNFFRQLQWAFNLAATMGGEYGGTPSEAGRVAGLAEMVTVHLSGPEPLLNLACIFLPLILCLLYFLEAWRCFRNSKDNWNVLFYLIPVICVGIVYAFFISHPRSLDYLLPAYLIAGVHLYLMFTGKIGVMRFQSAYFCLTVIIFCLFIAGFINRTRLMRYYHYRDQVVEQRCDEIISEYSGASLFFEAFVAQSVSVYQLIQRYDRELKKVFDMKFGTVHRYFFEDGHIEKSVLPTLEQPMLFFVNSEIKSDQVQLLDHISMAWVYIYYYNPARRESRSRESTNRLEDKTF